MNFQDLNLNTPAGAQVLYRRIRTAADQVCAVPGIRDLTSLGATKTCADHAIADAVAQVNNPQLTGVYETRVGAPVAIRLAAR